jgi:hypothetical protein
MLKGIAIGNTAGNGSRSTPIAHNCRGHDNKPSRVALADSAASSSGKRLISAGRTPQQDTPAKMCRFAAAHKAPPGMACSSPAQRRGTLVLAPQAPPAPVFLNFCILYWRCRFAGYGNKLPPQ